MFEWIKNLFGDPNERELNKLWPIVEEINAHYEELQDLTDDELRAKTDAFRAEIREAVADIETRQDEIREKLRRAPGPEGPVGGDGQVAEMEGEPLSLEERDALYDEFDELEEEWQDIVEDALWELLPEAFAVVKETCRRMLGETWMAGGSKIEWDMVPYDVQILGAIVLHQGRIAEMKTGEGKTLAAVMPLYLNALTGRGCQLVTVNDYLAERDTEWMGPIYEFHGLTVDCVNRYDPHTEGRKEAYEADITYGTNNEIGFDYLRDNSFVVRPEQLMQRGHHYAIIDEIDSVLIDEARTPLIISGPVPDQENDEYRELRDPVEQLVEAQRRLVRSYVKETRELLEEKEEAEENDDSRRAQELEDEAGLALFRASRGYPKNRQLQKLLNEPGMERLRQKTENFYLQENAKRMPFVDEELYFSVDEKKQSVEMTEKGQEYIAKIMGESADLFVLPVVGDKIAEVEDEYQEKVDELEEALQEKDLSQEKRENKYMNDKRELEKELQESKREIYNTYSERAERVHAIEQLLKAFTLYERDTEYIVQEGKVQIVDEHTGRVMEGRRYSEGLHEALEAKEEVEIYDLDVVVVPTHEPVRRDDKDDLVFQTKREKYNAIVEKVKEYNKRGQPVLVGSASVEVSETISRTLKREGIPHNVLNAKQDRAKEEAQIVAEAGQKGSVTIATNMAGRGTDIQITDEVRELGGLAILGSERHESRRIDLQLRGRAGRQGDPGESQFYVSLEDDLMRLFGSDRVAKVMDSMGIEEGEVITHPWINKSIKRAQSKVEQNNFAIRKRQLEYDDVLNSQREVIYKRRREALTGERFHGQVLNMLHEYIEALVERHYGQGNIAGLREDLLRTLAFDLEMEREEFVQLGEDGVVEHVYDVATDYYRQKRANIAQPFYQTLRDLKQDRGDNMIEQVFVDFTDGQDAIRAVADVDEALETNGQEINEALERTAMLQTIDEKWTDHLRELDELKEGIGLRSFGRKDPVVEYKMEAFDLFSDMMAEIGQEVVSLVFRAGPVVDDEVQTEGQGPRRRLSQRNAQTQHDSAQPDYSIDADGEGGGQEGEAAERDPTVEEKQPVTVADEPGRNEYVTVRNNANGETTEMKWKYAKKKINQGGWSLVS